MTLLGPIYLVNVSCPCGKPDCGAGIHLIFTEKPDHEDVLNAIATVAKITDAELSGRHPISKYKEEVSAGRYQVVGLGIFQNGERNLSDLSVIAR